MNEGKPTGSPNSTPKRDEPQLKRITNATSDIMSSIDSTGCTVSYGTRSRNRTSSSRPNYAEDKEADIEFEVAPAGCGRKAPRTSEAGNITESGKSIPNSRKNVQKDTESSLHTQNSAKESIPGASSFSANPGIGQVNSTLTKKRKAASQANQSLQTGLQNSAILPLSRKTTAVPQIAAGFRETNMMGFEKCEGRLTNGTLVADNGTVLKANDHVYLVCEPPGEPYYLGRIMEFIHNSNDISQPIETLRINWYYRPKDIGQKFNDTRQVYASMHSDVSPLTSLRGKCQIKHISEVGNMDEFRKTSDCFWYEKLYDRYIHRFYDVIPTSLVINVPVLVKKVLDEKWKFILVEPGRGKELTSAVKSCKRCSKYCASNNSVDCAVCENTYHMVCINPPLLKKPSRGFAWACGPCSKAQEKKLEARNIPNIFDLNHRDEDELYDEEIDSQNALADIPETDRISPVVTSDTEATLYPGATDQRYQASLWLFRYLGIHCKVEDVLDCYDRIYPRASSRIGPRHQANVLPWHGRPIEYVKPPEAKKKKMKGGGKRDSKLLKENLTASDTDKNLRDQRPKWILDEPQGHVYRGEDYDVTDSRCTSQILYKLPESSELPSSILGNRKPEEITAAERERIIFDYMERAAGLAKPLDLPPLSTNLLDIALEILHTNNYNSEKALDALIRVDRKIFKEPELSMAEIKRFEDGVAKFGSEWYSIKKHVKTVAPADIVRFYYTWKKTERGRQIWGSFPGRKRDAKKNASINSSKLQDDIADEHDDSAFDNDKAFRKKKGFQCKFCNTRNSRQWKRAPNTPPGCTIPENSNAKGSGKDKGHQLTVALCRRCAELWRRYAIQWEDVDELAKKISQTGARASKRKLEEDLMNELIAANEVTNLMTIPISTADSSVNSTPISVLTSTATGQDLPRKKVKASGDKDLSEPALESVHNISKKKLTNEKSTHEIPISPPPSVLEPPKAKVMPCAVCDEIEPLADQHLSCKDCRMTVHRNCYGVVCDYRSLAKWTCDMCSNDKNPQVSVQYKCMLCPIDFTEKDFIELPKVSNKKKTEKNRGKDRFDRENAQVIADYFRNKQIEMNKPVNPREPLKRTANNNWVHVTCAVFTPEVKFGNAKALEPSEGIPSIPAAKYEETCKICRNNRGACVSCRHCRTPVHVECAHQAGYVLGFDITPVKGSRRDQLNVVNIDDEVGTMSASIWCKDHVPNKTVVHRMHKIINKTGLNVLQFFVQNCKQADLTLTGTVRKATLIKLTTGAIANSSASSSSSRLPSNPNGVPNSMQNTGIVEPKNEDFSFSNSGFAKKSCVTCHIDVSPKWWPYIREFITQLKPSFTASIEVNGDNRHLLDKTPNKYNTTRSKSITSPENSAALATSALDQSSSWTLKCQLDSSEQIEYQCHQCHWKKIRRRENHTSTNSTDQMQSPYSSSVLVMHNSKAEMELVQAVNPSHSRPTPPIHMQNGLPNDQQIYGWHNRGTVAQSTSALNQTNGGCSPKVSGSVDQVSHSFHNQTRQQPSPNLQQNSRVSSLSNGCSSSQRSIGSMDHPVRKIPYTSYTSLHPSPIPPQHLVSGGSPPQASETLFIKSNKSIHHQHPSISPHQSSPSLDCETTPINQEKNIILNNNDRSNDGRIRGGASASPSLRNLLH
ncbi:putative bah domain-containing protein [Golovinomyces cichoracearum]|uniref:Putative bah domain-containing protein n=1 Tax=Golovinomyces cichoracearum TaxID=62708 RepID=A0A420IHP2_9PEZI|nr:putative bah domain-containing protein [Golovinomyces cichoracearum]